MPQSIQCTACGSSFQIPDELLGRAFRCRQCQKVIKTQTKEAASAVSPTAEKPISATRPVTPKPAPKSVHPSTEKSRAEPARAADKPEVKPVAKARLTTVVKKPVREELDELEIVESAPANEDFFEDEVKVVSRPSSRTVDSPRGRDRGRRGKSKSGTNGWLNQVGPVLLSPKLLVPVIVVGFAGWLIVTGVRGFNRVRGQMASAVMKRSTDLCNVQFPPFGELQTRFHGVAGSNTSELTATTPASELSCMTIIWDGRGASVGSTLDGGQVLDSVRQQLLKPCGKVEQEEAIELNGVSGREFHCRNGERETLVRAYANQRGVLVLKARSVPGQLAFAAERDQFLQSVELSDAFQKAAPAVALHGRGTTPRVTVAVANRNEPAAPPFNGGGSRTNNVASGSSVAAPAELIATVNTSFGPAPRATREFPIENVSAKPVQPGAPGSKPLAKNEFQVREWNVPIDPVGEFPAYDVGRPMSLAFTLPKRISTSPVVFAGAFSPCALIGDESQERVVWNLATRQRLGKFEAKSLAGSRIAISPDGRWLGEWSQKSSQARVWDVAAGRQQVEWASNSSPSEVRFLNPQRLMLVGNPITVHQSENGEVVCSLPATRSIRQSVAVSPGGKLIAVQASKELLVCDAEQGAVRGRIEFEDHHFRSVIAFSPDGRLLALAGNQWLRVFRVADGSVAYEFPVPEMNQADFGSNRVQGVSLQCFPGNGGWLIADKFFVRPDLKGTVWTFETMRSSSQPWQLCVVAGETRILRVAPDPNGGKFEFLEVGAKALETQQGDVLMATDVLLPKLTLADWSSVREVLPVSPTEWRVPAKGSESGLPASSALMFDLNGRVSRGAILTGTKQLALLTQPTGGGGSSKKEKGKGANDNIPDGLSLELYELAGNVNSKKSPPQPAKPSRRAMLKFPCDLVDVSPSARFALVRPGDIDPRSNRSDQAQWSGRLDVIDTNTGEPLVGFRPFFEVLPGAGVSQAAFVDDEHLLTVTYTRHRDTEAMLVLWEIPQCRAVYVMQGVATRTLSANRRLLGVSRQVGALRQRQAAAKDEPTGLFVLDTLTGATLGYLPGGTAVTHAVFHPREPRLFALTQNEALDVAIEWDLKTGQVRREFPLPSESFQSEQLYDLRADRTHERRMEDDSRRSIAWTANNQLLVNQQTILDLTREIYSAKVRINSLIVLPQNLDARVWFLNEIDSSKHHVVVGASELPDPKMSETIQLAMPRAEKLLFPGAKLALSFQLTALTGELAAEVEKRVRDQLELLEVSVAGDAEVSLVVSAVEGHSGGTDLYVELPQRYSPFAPFGGRQEIPNRPLRRENLAVKQIVCKFQLLRGGKVEKQFHSSRGNSTGFFMLKQNEQLQQVADAQLRTGTQDLLLHTRLPPYIFSNEWRKGVTSWRIDSRGVEREGVILP